MATVPNKPTQYSCTFKSTTPIVRKFTEKDPNNIPSLYSLDTESNIYKSKIEKNKDSYCESYMPLLQVYAPDYYSKVNDEWSKSKKYHVVQDLSSIQNECNGHRITYSYNVVSSVNELREVGKQTDILAEKYNTIIDIIDKEFDKRKESNKYKDIDKGTKPLLLQINENDKEKNPDVLAKQLNDLNNYIANKELNKDRFTPLTVNIEANTTILAANINSLINNAKNMLQDCICYSDCNGYSVCWCYGNCNYY